MCHDRWLTRANRILRLYVLMEFLKILVCYQNWLYCKDGARQLFKLIATTRYLHTELKVQVDPVIQKNSYFDHPENLLFAMVTDSEPHIAILKARGIRENEF
ncbi:hypothetical protein AVEN_44667-1 [Araneus ventricosus]|uniref:Uncharacterized protein n=1 Tax=Araneus ventricosus TaxID=182803 RepID=A0A4Y2QX07_ARAVE|nr:hypothetical protein AVEN_44667-1 [Araneus ventricosus]